jgi:CHAT domain-containing protein
LRQVLAISQPATPGFGAIKGTIVEVANLRRHFAANQIVHLDGEAASTVAVLAALNTHRPQIIHLACHGVQDNKQPLDSAFILHDGRLPLSTLIATSINSGAELAFLSACQTATGDEKIPDEAVHLAAGMLVVGYRAVVGTMWSIGDQDAPLVADEVYARLTGHAGKTGQANVAYALHDAVNCLRKQVGDEEFIRWVPFVHYGL